MSQKEDVGLAQTDELICPPMTLVQQVKGTIYLTRLALVFARLIVEIIKLIKPYRSMTSQPMTEIATGIDNDSGEIEHNLAKRPL